MASGLSDQFGSFDFFSVFVPGAAFLVGIVPFLPRQTPLASLGTVVPLFVGGVVIGRIAYGVSVVTSRPRDSTDRTLVGRTLLQWFDALRSRPSGEASHREQFVRGIRRDDPGFVSSATADHLYTVAQTQFENGVVGDIGARTDLSETAAEELYGLIRATIHADGRVSSSRFTRSTGRCSSSRSDCLSCTDSTGSYWQSTPPTG